jgi:hypothetical protein
MKGPERNARQARQAAGRSRKHCITWMGCSHIGLSKAMDFVGSSDVGDWVRFQASTAIRTMITTPAAAPTITTAPGPEEPPPDDADGVARAGAPVGALVGSRVGAAVGSRVGAAVVGLDDDGAEDDGASEDGAGVGVAVGAGVGAADGAMAQTTAVTREM